MPQQPHHAVDANGDFIHLPRPLPFLAHATVYGLPALPKLHTHHVDLLPTEKMKTAAISANTDSLCSTSRSLYRQTTNRVACS